MHQTEMENLLTTVKASTLVPAQAPQFPNIVHVSPEKCLSTRIPTLEGNDTLRLAIESMKAKLSNRKNMNQPKHANHQ